MTIASTTSKVSYNGSGSVGPYSIPYKFTSNADIVATHVSTTGAETTLALTTDYTLTGAGNPSGGTLTLVSALTTGQKLVIKRSPSIVQETDYVENAAFPAAAHEDALDKLTMICQDLDERIERAVLVDISSSTSPEDLLDEIAADVASAEASATTATTKAGEASASAASAAVSAAALPNAASIGAGNVPVSNGTTWTGAPAGTGDMLKSENLSGLANYTTARSNLGLAIGTNVLAPNGDGSALTGITASQISGLSTAAPTSAILPIASGSVPSGYLECNGAAVSRTTYADLFTAIGTKYGIGDGSTTFNLMDLRSTKYNDIAGTMFTKNLTTTNPVTDFSLRVVVPAASLLSSGYGVRITIKAGSGGALTIDNASIVERDGTTANGTTTPTNITFNMGMSSVAISTASAVAVSDIIPYAIDSTKSYLVIFDVNTTNGNAAIVANASAITYTKAATNSYNQQTVTGFSADAFDYVMTKLEVGVGKNCIKT